MKVYFEKRILAGFFLAIIILVGLGMYSFSNNQKSIQASRMISHTNEVLFYIEQLNSSLLTIETEVLRFNILGDTSFVHFFKNEINLSAKYFRRLHELTKDNSIQESYLDSLQRIGRKKVDHTLKIIEAKLKLPNEISPLIPSAYNRSIMVEIKHIISSMKSEETKLLQDRISNNEYQIQKFNATYMILQVFMGLILIAVIITINNSLRRRIKAEDALKLALDDSQDLYNNAPCGYHSLDSNGYFMDMNNTMLEWIGYTREEVIGKMTMLNIITEDDVDAFHREYANFRKQGFVKNVEFNIQRKDATSFPIILNSLADVDEDGVFLRSRSSTFDNTDRKLAEIKITQLNNELEAFTYSVSHDLRAPLRSIDGYAKILQEDYSKQIDAEGNRLIEIIIRNARRMGQLIDDLLDFSRIGRTELSKSKTDLNLIIDSVKHELMENEKRNDVVFIIHPLEPVIGDPNMLRQVWVNLISNALKYSRNQHPAQIEIGSYQQEDKIVYFIRDNGVGFDMKYSNKLFGVFQRLHKVQDFEGTGVGLALVHRIVTRHEGKIWADANVNEGATFSFFIL